MLGARTGGWLPNGVLVFVEVAGLVSVYSENPPPGLDWASDVPAAKTGAPRGTPGASGGCKSMAVLLKEGKSEKAGLPPPMELAPGPIVGGPLNVVATP